MPIPRPTMPLRRSRSSDVDVNTFERSSARFFGPRYLYDNAHKDNRSASRDKVSPLAPTFGPRKGLVPSGTLDRRRTPRHVPSLDQRQLIKPGVGCVESRCSAAHLVNGGKKVLPDAIVISGEGDGIVWEPGWGYVEVSPANSSTEDLEEAVEEIHL